MPNDEDLIVFDNRGLTVFLRIFQGVDEFKIDEKRFNR
jgi:hypothetical protein